MPSLNGKLSMLADSYEHSKSSPAYRDLKIKYKALKQQNQELLNLIARLFSDFGGVQEVYNVEEAPSKNRKYNKNKLNQIPELVEDEPAINIIVEEREQEEEDGITEEDFEVQEELDSDIKEQFIEETAAEIFMISRGTDTDYDESDEVVEVVEDEVEETEEVEIVVEETEEIEVEEEEEIEVEEEEEVEETEEVEEEVEVEETEEVEEEEEAGVYEIELNGNRYYTTNEQNGIVYELVGEDDVGDEIGKFVNGKLVLNK